MAAASADDKASFDSSDEAGAAKAAAISVRILGTRAAGLVRFHCSAQLNVHDPALAQPDAAAFKMCKLESYPATSHVQRRDFASVPQVLPAVAPSIQQLLSDGGDHKPQLCATDIQFRTHAGGKRIVLGGGAFSTVSNRVLSAAVLLRALAEELCAASVGAHASLNSLPADSGIRTDRRCCAQFTAVISRCQI